MSVVSEDRAKEIADLYDQLGSVKAVARAKGIAESTVDRYLRDSNRGGKQIDPSQQTSELESTGPNTAQLTTEGTQVRTKEQAIEYHDIDTDIWKVSDYDTSTWNAQKKGGKVVQMSSVKLDLVKRVMDKTVFDPVQPTTLDFEYDPPSKPEADGLKTGVLIPDTHIGYRRESYSRDMIPFHDRRCLDIDLQLIRDVDPDIIIILGDFLDMPNWSKKFVRSPEFSSILQAAVKEGHWWLRNMREIAPDAEIKYIQGNHGERVPRFLKSSTKAAYGIKPATATEDAPDLVSVERMLDLPSLQVEWIGDYPDGGHWINDNLVAEHGSTTSSVSGKTAGKVLDDARESHVFAHVHRVESATKTAYPQNGPKEYRAISLGCQVYLDGKGTEVPGNKKKQDWQDAVGIVEYESGNGYFSVNPIMIYDGEMIYDGKKYTGETRLNDLVAQAGLEKYNFVDNR